MTKLANFVKKLLDTLNVRSYGEKILYDLQESWYYIVIGIFAGAFISFIWIIMMRFVAAVMVWASIILSILMLGIVYVQTYFGKKYIHMRCRWTLTALSARSFPVIYFEPFAPSL